MSDKPQTTPEERETSDQKAISTVSDGKRSKRSSVYTYLIILFGAAFLMLLLAYFVQRRNNESVLSDLRSTTASRQELLKNIEELEQETLALEEQITELEQELQQEKDASYEFQVLYDGSRNTASHLQFYLLQRTQAMELFWQLDRAYTQGRNQQCQELIQWLEAPETDPLKDYLPDDSDRSEYDYGFDWPSPAERYQEIFEKLS